ncbi:MAG: hypothetical protein J3K34DRAFT_400129 [Monoraphidium minutum]|nr:MAG: hypothetical protein J3K34DRAFT_400129 [Monoraphidium minutum]
MRDRSMAGRHMPRRSAAAPFAAAAALLLALRLAAPAAAAEPVKRPLNIKTPVGYGEVEEEWRGEVVHLSWRPRAFLYKRFLNDEECDYIREKAADKLEKSGVVDNETGEETDSHVRTSTGTFFDIGADEVISRIERRVAQVTMLPVENQEGLQVLKYVNGQEYQAHYDFFWDKKNQDPAEGGQRVVTALMYLSTPEEGGETVFPDAEVQSDHEPGASACASKGLVNKIYKGDMLVFYSLTPEGETDLTSLHASCPTLKGEKWSATKWIHVSAFRQTAELLRAKGGCEDVNEFCPAWAATGECERNAGYMRTACRLSCQLCTPAADAADGAGAAEQAGQEL